MSSGADSSQAEPETASTPSTRRLGAFALVFGISFATLYVISDMASLPMFTYHPATGRIDLGFARPRPDEGPAMYWYGWIATSALGALVLGLAAALLPERVSGKIPPALAWIAPIALLPFLVYSLKFYWRW